MAALGCLKLNLKELRKKKTWRLLIAFTVTALIIFTGMLWQLDWTYSRSISTSLPLIKLNNAVSGSHWQLKRSPNGSMNDTCDLFPPIKIVHTEISLNETCEANFCSTFEGNRRKIESYNFIQAEPYLHHLVPKKFRESIWNGRGSSFIELPVLVSGASSNHFEEALELFPQLDTYIYPAYSTEFYFFDLGLWPSQLRKIKEVCNCKVIKFPFEKFPAYVSELHAYCWKPLAIQLMLQYYQFVMWIDTSIRFKTSDLDVLFVRAKKYGLLSRYDTSDSYPLPSHLHEDTFLFLQEPPCLYKNYHDWQGGLIIVHGGHELIYKYIIQTWIKCALVEECMKTKQNIGGNMLYCKTHKFYHSCHRYEQATLGLFLHRLFPDSFNDYHLDNDNYYYFKRIY